MGKREIETKGMRVCPNYIASKSTEHHDDARIFPHQKYKDDSMSENISGLQYIFSLKNKNHIFISRDIGKFFDNSKQLIVSKAVVCWK